MVLLIAILLLGVVPASFLLLGRLIMSTDKRASAAMKAREAELSARPQTRPAGEPSWYRQPMRPAFTKPTEDA